MNSESTIKVFVINLKRSTERREHIENQMQNLGLNYEFIEATDGRSLDEKGVENLYDKKESLKYLQKELSVNEIACSHSHYKAYLKIKEEKINYALVLEDDVLIDQKLIELLDEKKLSNMRFDILLVGNSVRGMKYFKSWHNDVITNFKRNKTTIFYNLLKIPYVYCVAIYETIRFKCVNKKTITAIYLPRPTYCGFSYIISKEAIDKMNSIVKPIKFAADMAPNKARVQAGLVLKVSSQPCVYHSGSFESDIGKR